jgi:hypothetical protein
MGFIQAFEYRTGCRNSQSSGQIWPVWDGPVDPDCNDVAIREKNIGQTSNKCPFTGTNVSNKEKDLPTGFR